MKIQLTFQLVPCWSTGLAKQTQRSLTTSAILWCLKNWIHFFVFKCSFLLSVHWMQLPHQLQFGARLSSDLNWSDFPQFCLQNQPPSQHHHQAIYHSQEQVKMEQNEQTFAQFELKSSDFKSLAVNGTICIAKYKCKINTSINTEMVSLRNFELIFVSNGWK